jgi:thiol-disulfide isomerase/thioredoxin
MVDRWPARSLLFVCLVLLAASILLAACGRDEGRSASGPSIAVEDLPAGIGRGYAEVQAEGKAAGAPPALGEPASDFRLVLDDGRSLSLQSLHGRPVLINHWATWCRPCRAEMPLLVQAARDHPDLVVIAANLQEARSQVEPFAAEFALDLPVVMDTNGALRDLYAVRGLPTTYAIDREGRIAGVHPGALDADDLEALLAKVL